MITKRADTQFALATLLLTAVLWLMAPQTYAHDGPHNKDCGDTRIIIEGGQPASFTLPSQAHETLDIEPGAVLTIRGIDMPAEASLHWGVQGFGTELAGRDLKFSSGVTTVNVADFSSHARGIYEIEGTLRSGSKELCTIPLKVNITGFGGTAAFAATGVSAVAGVGALASAPLAANGLSAKLDAKVELARRRPQGMASLGPRPRLETFNLQRFDRSRHRAGTGRSDATGRDQPPFAGQCGLGFDTGRRRQFRGRLLSWRAQNLPETAGGELTDLPVGRMV